jgi:DHA2 family multidrug resistance protein
VQTLTADQVRMGQGLLGVVRSIGASLGVTVTSVFFERRRAHHQLQAYSNYDPASATHESTLQDIQRWLHDAGIVGTRGDQEALETIRQQMDIETMAISFQESFLFIGLCFIIAMGPMLCLLSRRLRVPVSVA